MSVAQPRGRVKPDADTKKRERDAEIERLYQARNNIHYYECELRRGARMSKLQAEFILSYEPKDGLQMVEVAKVRALGDKIRELKKAKADKAVVMVAVDDLMAAKAAYLEAYFPYPK